MIASSGFNRRRAFLAVLLVACAATLVVGGWAGEQVWQARRHLIRASTLFDRLHGQLAHGDYAGGQVTLKLLGRETRAAEDATRGWAWRGGGYAPKIGDDVRAVRVVAAALDELARQVLPPLADVAGKLDTLAPRGARIDLGALNPALARIPAADSAVRRIRDRLAAIDTGGLDDRLAEPVARLRQELDRVVGLADTAVRAVQILPLMLGLREPRTYLVLFFNPAEVRASGGMPGAYLVVGADHGTLRVVDEGMASGGLPVTESPVLPLDPAMVALYGTSIGRYPANLNLTPDFPTTARLAREMYRRVSGRTVDGVLATDPIALSYLLRATGPVTVPSGPTLTADTAVHVLLSDVYSGGLNRGGQDRYFTAAARATFEALTTRPLDIRLALAGLARAAGERRLLAWSADPSDERLVAGTVLEGVLPTDDPDRPTVGVFLNDGGAGKMSYYLRPAAELETSTCVLGGRARLTVRVTLASAAPGSGLSPYVRNSTKAVDSYTIRTLVSVFSPTGGAMVDARLDGTVMPLASGTEHRRAVGIVRVDLPPGASRVLEVTMLGAAATVRAPRLWTTPTVSPWQISYLRATPC